MILFNRLYFVPAFLPDRVLIRNARLVRGEACFSLASISAQAPAGPDRWIIAKRWTRRTRAIELSLLSSQLVRVSTLARLALLFASSPRSPVSGKEREYISSTIASSIEITIRWRSARSQNSPGPQASPAQPVRPGNVYLPAVPCEPRTNPHKDVSRTAQENSASLGSPRICSRQKSDWTPVRYLGAMKAYEAPGRVTRQWTNKIQSRAILFHPMSKQRRRARSYAASISLTEEPDEDRGNPTSEGGSGTNADLPTACFLR